MRSISAMVLTIALSSVAVGVVADDNDPPADARDVQIQIDPVLLRLLTSPDAILIKVLHERSEEKLLTNLGITTDQRRIAIGRFQKKTLAFHKEYKLGDKRRHVFVYDPSLHSWPGTQPETIIICDASYRPLDWKEVGGSPMFERAALESSADTGPVLHITRRHRHTIPNPQRGIYRFLLKNDTIKAILDIEWLYTNDAERAQYARWRESLRERDGTNRNNAVEQTDEREPD